MQQQAIWQGVHCERPATGVHYLIANPADSGACATTTSDPGPSLSAALGHGLGSRP